MKEAGEGGEIQRKGGKEGRQRSERRDSLNVSLRAKRLEGNGNLIIRILLCLTGAFTNTVILKTYRISVLELYTHVHSAKRRDEGG